MHVYVCMYVCVYVYVCCMYVCIYVCMCVCVFVCVCMYVCMCVRVCVFVCVCMYVCMYIRMCVLCIRTVHALLRFPVCCDHIVFECLYLHVVFTDNLKKKLLMVQLRCQGNLSIATSLLTLHFLCFNTRKHFHQGLSQLISMAQQSHVLWGFLSHASSSPMAASHTAL